MGTSHWRNVHVDQKCRGCRNGRHFNCRVGLVSAIVWERDGDWAKTLKWYSIENWTEFMVSVSDQKKNRAERSEWSGMDVWRTKFVFSLGQYADEWSEGTHMIRLHSVGQSPEAFESHKSNGIAIRVGGRRLSTLDINNYSMRYVWLEWRHEDPSPCHAWLNWHEIPAFLLHTFSNAILAGDFGIIRLLIAKQFVYFISVGIVFTESPALCVLHSFYSFCRPCSTDTEYSFTTKDQTISPTDCVRTTNQEFQNALVRAMVSERKSICKCIIACIRHSDVHLRAPTHSIVVHIQRSTHRITATRHEYVK